MGFSVTRLDDRVIIHVPEWLITANKGVLRQLALDALDEGGRRFTVDLVDTTYIDSSGLGTLVGISKKIHEQQGNIRLVHLSDDISTLFRLTKLDAYFDGLGGGPSAA
ncbi:MAG TPA: STAS domain-containing protein [Gemmatimonadaceae bacterium]|jgi:anti-sigma B factor antagonist